MTGAGLGDAIPTSDSANARLPAPARMRKTGIRNGGIARKAAIRIPLRKAASSLRLLRRWRAACAKCPFLGFSVAQPGTGDRSLYALYDTDTSG